jgi:UDP-N-acetylglucosamine transferase subunit ALG13
MIKVALGTEKFQFNRLMEWIDKAIDDGVLSETEEILVQSGSTVYTPKHNNIVMTPIVPYQEQMQEFKNARISIIHAGIGNVLDMADLNRVPIIVPRDPMRKEHVDGHQLNFCQIAEKELELPIVYTYVQFVEAIKNYDPEKTFPSYRKQLVEYLVSVVES